MFGGAKSHRQQRWWHNMVQGWGYFVVNHGHGLVDRGVGESTVYMHQVCAIAVGAADAGVDGMRPWATRQWVQGERHGEGVPVPGSAAQGRHGTRWWN
jgi:hypothetical protein